MKNNFTTPEFADTLAKHGIVVDTPYNHYFDIAFSPFVSRIGIDCDYGMLDIETRHMTEGQNVHNAKPAYPLTEVLRWLPSQINSNSGLFLSIHTKPEIKIKACYSSITTWLNIEDLITQGFEQGWLDKKTILKNAQWK